MKFVHKFAFLAASGALALLARCPAQSASPAAPNSGPVIVADFSNPGLSPAQWTLVLHPDGSGHFRSQGSAAPGPGEDLRAPNIDRDIHLTPKFAEDAFQVAGHHHWFNEKCESHMKVAFQGLKTLAYSGPEGKGSCTFNYSRDKQIQALGDSFVAVAQTIVEGERLEILLKHDPLGLDKEIENLAAAAQDGRAQQICVIRAILERLAQDDSVMDLVRKRARSLLARADT